MPHDGRWARQVTIYCCHSFRVVAFNTFLALSLPYANYTRLSELVLVFVLGLAAVPYALSISGSIPRIHIYRLEIRSCFFLLPLTVSTCFDNTIEVVLALACSEIGLTDQQDRSLNLELCYLVVDTQIAHDSGFTKAFEMRSTTDAIHVPPKPMGLCFAPSRIRKAKIRNFATGPTRVSPMISSTATPR
jgi:hypothetical protein